MPTVCPSAVCPPSARLLLRNDRQGKKVAGSCYEIQTRLPPPPPAVLLFLSYRLSSVKLPRSGFQWFSDPDGETRNFRPSLRSGRCFVGELAGAFQKSEAMDIYPLWLLSLAGRLDVGLDQDQWIKIVQSLGHQMNTPYRTGERLNPRTTAVD